MLLRQESQRQRRSAFTLMEMLVVVAIIVALAGIGGFFLLGQLSGAQEDIAKTQVKGPLTQACQAYFIRHKEYPQNLQQLTQRDPANGNAPYLDSADALLDPWGHPYQYDASGQQNNGTKPDIWTMAPQSGGNVQTKIGNWPTQRQQ
jgi:general secretion pathway protein G